jgi:butyryl-CoA dehydrogenase/short/branched chain acyl-CoA dehydrogenase
MPFPLQQLEEEMFRDSVRAFAREKIAPRVREMDERGEFSHELLADFFRLGWMGVEIPEELGGAGGSFVQCLLAIEELAVVDPSAAIIVDVHNTVVNRALLGWATDDQKRRWLPRLAKDTVGAFALSEAGAGSDAFSLTTTADDCGDYFLLRGRKLWVTNAAEAGLFIIFANADPAVGHRGTSAFMVERDFPSFSVGRKEDKLGIRASSTCELLLEDCRVPRENLIGTIGEGYKIAIETLNAGRIGIGAQMLGLARGSLDHALRYAKEREQFGRPITEFQAVRFQLAEMATEVEATRLMVYEAARRCQAGLPIIQQGAMVKYFSSQVAERAASAAVDLHGGYGYVKDYPVEKLYRDAKIGKIYEGTSNMQLETIARQLLSFGQ